MFNSKKDFDFDLWRNWLLDDIIKLCIKARESGDLKSLAIIDQADENGFVFRQQ